MKQATMQPTDELGQFIREQTPPVVLRRPFPACMHNPLRSSDAGNQSSNFGGTYEDECLHGPHPGHVVTWHNKRVPPPERPPLTL